MPEPPSRRAAGDDRSRATSTVPAGPDHVPTALEAADAAFAIAGAPAQVVVFDGDEALPIAAAPSDGGVPSARRPLHECERRLVERQTSAEQADGHTAAVIVDPDGAPVGAVSVAATLEHHLVGLLVTQARVVSAMNDLLGRSRPDGTQLGELVLHGLRDTVVVLDDTLAIRRIHRTGSLGRGPQTDDVFGRDALDLVHPDDLVAVIRGFARLDEGEPMVDLRIRTRRLDGAYEQVQLNGVDRRGVTGVDGYVISLRRIDVVAEVWESMDRVERTSHTILTGLHDGIVTTDAYGHVVLANGVARDLFGVDRLVPASDLGRSTFTLTDEHGLAVRLVEIDCHGDGVCGTYRVDDGGDHDRWVEVSRQEVVDGSGRTTGAVWVLHDVTTERRAAERLRHEALHDQLTSLPNRRALAEQLDSIARTRRGQRLAACFVDLDGFKLVNDNHGHRIGDRLIEIAARRLRRVVRSDDFLARLGGDEFVVLHLAAPDESEILALAERLRSSMQRPFDVDGHQFELSASIGIAVSDVSGLDAELLLQRADIALYAAKAAGRNRCEVFDQALADSSTAEEHRHDFLRGALRGGRVVAFFQPLTDATSDRTVGYEALARIEADDGSVVGPAGFIAETTPTELLDRLDLEALRQACAAIAHLDDVAADPPDYVSCNLSPSTIRRVGIVDRIVGIVGDHRVDPHRICLEITETAALEAGEAVIEVLDQLRALGFRIALDDFGTGYSSLAHLRDLPIDMVKIDRSFITELLHDGTERAIAETIVALARRLGLSVVAEGVETEDQLAAARELGFDTIQGWYHAPPRPLRDL